MRKPKFRTQTTIRAVPDAEAANQFHQQGNLLIGLAYIWMKDATIRPAMIGRAFAAGAALHFLAKAVHDEAHRRVVDELITTPG